LETNLETNLRDKLSKFKRHLHVLFRKRLRNTLGGIHDATTLSVTINKTRH